MDVPDFPPGELFRVLELPVTDDEALIRKTGTELRSKMEMLERKATTATEEETVKKYNQARVWLTNGAKRQICIDQHFHDECVASVESNLAMLGEAELTTAAFGRMAEMLVKEKNFEPELAGTRLKKYLEVERLPPVKIGDKPNPASRPLPLPVRETTGISFATGEVRVRWAFEDPEACEFRLYRTPHKLAPSVDMDEPIYTGNSASYPDPDAPVGRISDYFVVASRGGRSTSPVLVESALNTAEVNAATAIPGDKSVTVSWEPQKAAMSFTVSRQILSADGVTVKKNWHDIAVRDTTAAPQIVDSPLDHARCYRYRIQCRFADEGTEQMTAGCTTDAVRPLLHISESSVTASAGSMKVAWKHKEPGYKYRVYRVPAGTELNTDFDDPLSDFSSQKFYVDTLMLLGQEWDYYVEAQSDDACLPPTKAGSDLAFDEVADAMAEAGERSVMVSWTPPDAVSGISIERRKLNADGRVLEDWLTVEGPEDEAAARWQDDSVTVSYQYAYRLKCIYTRASGEEFRTAGRETDPARPFAFPEAPQILASFDGENAVIRCREVDPDFDVLFYRSNGPFTESSERLISVDGLTVGYERLKTSKPAVRDSLHADTPWFIVCSPIGDVLDRVYIFRQFYFSALTPRILAGFGSFIVEWDWPDTARAMRVRLECETKAGRTTHQNSTIPVTDEVTTGKFSIDKPSENDPNYPVCLTAEVVPEFSEEADVVVVNAGSTKTSFRPNRQKIPLSYAIEYKKEGRVFKKQIPWLVICVEDDVPKFGGVSLEAWPLHFDETAARKVMTWNGAAGGLRRGKHSIGRIEVDEPKFGRLVLNDPKDADSILIIPPRDGRLTLGDTG